MKLKSLEDSLDKSSDKSLDDSLDDSLDFDTPVAKSEGFLVH